MTTATIPALERTVQQTHEWVNSISAKLGRDDPQRAYRALRVTLHVLRDRLPTAEAAHLAILEDTAVFVHLDSSDPLPVEVPIKHVVGEPAVVLVDFRVLVQFPYPNRLTLGTPVMQDRITHPFTIL